MIIPGKNLAYDLTLFETKPKEQKIRENKNNVVKLPKRNTRKNIKTKFSHSLAVKAIIFSAIGACVVLANIHSQVQLSELTDETHKVQQNLDEMQSKYTQLKMKLESQLSLKEIEQYAKNTIGMQKPDTSKIKYIKLSEKDKAEIKNK